MDGRAVRRDRRRRPRARPLPARAAARARAPGTASTCRSRPPPATSTPSSRPGRALPRQPRDRRAAARLHALERDGHGGQGQPAPPGRRRRPGRPHQLASRRWPPCSAPASTTSGTPRAKSHGGDCLYIQGHSSPGIYARAFLEGRLTEEQLLNFRQEVDGKGLSSYPHPKLMPEFWQFPTVSMGLGPLMAIYQARFLKYLHARGIANTENRKVWVFCGDGEMDELESLGAIGLAAREKLDNLIFVINCNLQRLDGPVRGNGKIIQELEGEFRGAGWNVIKLIWGSYWDPLLARDKDGALRKIMMDTLDGDYQAMKANDGAFVRKHFFGRDPQAAGDGRQDERRRHLAPAARRPRSAEGLRGLPPRQQPQGPADGAADQDRQGLRHGQERRGQEHRAPDQEADRRRHPHLPRPLQHPDSGRPAGRHPVLQAGRRHAGDEVPARAPQGAGRLPAAAPHQGRRAAHGAAARNLQGRARRHRRRPRNLHHAGLRALPDRAAARQGRWARASCRSWSTRRAPSAWKACSARSASTTPRARSTRRSTRTRSCTTAKTRPARSCRKASTRPAAWRSWIAAATSTAPTTASWCRSTSTTRCSASSASATWPGRPATCRRAASCSAAPRGAPR